MRTILFLIVAGCACLWWAGYEPTKTTEPTLAPAAVIQQEPEERPYQPTGKRWMGGV